MLALELRNIEHTWETTNPKLLCGTFVKITISPVSIGCCSIHNIGQVVEEKWCVVDDIKVMMVVPVNTKDVLSICLLVMSIIRKIAECWHFLQELYKLHIRKYVSLNGLIILIWCRRFSWWWSHIRWGIIELTWRLHQVRWSVKQLTVWQGPATSRDCENKQMCEVSILTYHGVHQTSYRCQLWVYFSLKIPGQAISELPHLTSTENCGLTPYFYLFLYNLLIRRNIWGILY